MKSEFSFNEVSLSDIEKYANSSNVFNLSEDDILKEVITLASFHDENLGSSEEKLDLAIYNNKEWKLLDIEDKIGDNNQIPLSYLLKDISFSRVLVLIRRMSSMLLDRKQTGVSSYILCKVKDKYKDVHLDKALFGLLAKSHVYLDQSESEIKEQIQKNIFDRNEEICSRLFA